MNTPPEPEKPTEEQILYRHTLISIGKFLDKLMHYNGSKSQLQRTWKNVAWSKVIREEELEWSYPEEKELCDAFEEVMANKFTFFLTQLRNEGKIVFNETETNKKEGE